MHYLSAKGPIERELYCSGQVISDRPIGSFTVGFASEAAGGRQPKAECKIRSGAVATPLSVPT